MCHRRLSDKRTLREPSDSAMRWEGQASSPPSRLGSVRETVLQLSVKSHVLKKAYATIPTAFHWRKETNDILALPHDCR